jgi:hypothetical protein
MKAVDTITFVFAMGMAAFTIPCLAVAMVKMIRRELGRRREQRENSQG